MIEPGDKVKLKNLCLLNGLKCEVTYVRTDKDKIFFGVRLREAVQNWNKGTKIEVFSNEIEPDE